MHTKIVPGKKIAKEIINNLKTQFQTTSTPKRLDIFVCEPNGAIKSFVAKKRRIAKSVGVDFKEHYFDATTTTEEIQSTIDTVKHKTSGIVIQLPMPEHIDTTTLLNNLPLHLDVDVLGEHTFQAFQKDEISFEPPVAGAVREILERYTIPTEGAKAVMLGKGRLVGLPTTIILERLGCHVFVADHTTPQSELAYHLARADIICSGTGVANLITPEKIKEGVVLLDAGTSGSKATLTGDISYSCEDKARLFSRTPGGIGPITVAILFKNLVHNTMQ